MVGREAYHNPWLMAEWDTLFYADSPHVPNREAVEQAMVGYMEREAREHGVGWYSIARHMLGLWHGQPGARRWRQVWSDHHLKDRSPREVSTRAQSARIGLV